MGSPIYNRGGRGIIASASFVRPANTTAYASGDLVANSTTAGSVTPLALAIGRGAGGLIHRVRLVTDSTSITTADFRAHFYSAAPAVTNGDNGAWDSDGALNYLGACDVTVGEAFSDGAAGFGVPNKGTEIFATVDTVYALIEARSSYTPTSGETFTLAAEVIQN